MADPALLAHVLRRMTFGPGPGAVEALGDTDPSALIDTLLDAPPLDVDDPELGTNDDYDVLIRWWLQVLARPDAGLHERMVWFWHGHLTSSLAKVEPALMLRQHRLFREHALGNARALFQAVTTDAAMLAWLDGNGSEAANPNENYAREVMELFALGHGNFSEADVRAGAYLFAGWYIDGDNSNAVVLDPENGPTETRELLGATVSSSSEAIDAICDHEAFAPHLAGKVYEHFVGTPPDDAVLGELAGVLRDSGLEIAPLVAAVVHRPEFLTSRANRPRTALEFFLAARSFLETDLDHYVLDQLGQVPFQPPNVAGWPGSARWVSAGATFAKVQLAVDNSGDTVATDTDDPVGDLLGKAALYDVSAQTRRALDQAAGAIDSRRDRATLLHALVVASPEFSIS